MKLSKKFLLTVSIVLVSVMIFSIYINSKYVGKIYNYIEKENLRQLSKQIHELSKLDEVAITKIEQKNNVILIKQELNENIDALNETLHSRFIDRGISIEKYWFWDGDYQHTIKNGTQLKIYGQPRFDYSIMALYMIKEEQLVIIAKTVPNLSRFMPIFNLINGSIFIGAAVVMIVVLSWLIKKITKPLEKIGEAVENIAKQEFETVTIQSRDEVAILGERINQMSQRIKEQQQELEQKNRQMKNLLENVAHDLKTPIALIRTYAQGIQDELDDGTFVEIIFNQSHKMKNMVDQLLELSKLETISLELKPLNLSEALENILKIYWKLNALNIFVKKNIEDNLLFIANDKMIESLFENLLSNAFKYSKSFIEIKMYQDSGLIVLEIKNDFEGTIEVDRLWEPFYVGEKSRNKLLSGSGIGLSIVRAICQKYNYRYYCTHENNTIEFKIILGHQQ